MNQAHLQCKGNFYWNHIWNCCWRRLETSGSDLCLVSQYLGRLHQVRLHHAKDKSRKIWPTWQLNSLSPGLNLPKYLFFFFVFLPYQACLPVLSHNKAVTTDFDTCVSSSCESHLFFLPTTLSASEWGESSQNYKRCTTTNGVFLCFICTSMCFWVLFVCFYELYVLQGMPLT